MKYYKTRVERSIERHIELSNKPIQEIIDMFEWKNGEVEFDLYATSGHFLSDELFGVVQDRQEEIKALGHKVKRIENNGWGTIRRKFVIYDLERPKENKYINVDIIVISLISLMFCLFIIIC